jgi:spore germination protein KC
MMKRILTRTVPCLIGLMGLTGCWDRVEVNDVAFVSGTAVDLENKQYRVTTQIPLPSQLGGIGGSGGGGGTSGKKPYYLSSSLGITVRDANTQQQQALSRRLYYAHRRVLLFGEDLAKAGIASTIDLFGRLPQNRITAFVMITKGNAAEYFDTDISLEKMSSEFLREIAEQFSKVPVTMKEIIDTLLKEGQDLAIPYIMITNSAPNVKKNATDNIRANGIAIFRDDRMVATLSKEDSLGLLWMMGTVRETTITVDAPDESGKLTVLLHDNNTKMDVKINNGEPVVMIKVETSGIIAENESAYPMNKTENVKSIEQRVSDKITEQMNKTLGLLQQKYQSDPVGFGDLIHRKHASLWKNLKARWAEEVYPELSVRFQVTTDLEHSGSIVAPLGLKEVKSNSSMTREGTP